MRMMMMMVVVLRGVHGQWQNRGGWMQLIEPNGDQTSVVIIVVV